MRGQLRIDLADNCNIRCIACQAHSAAPPSQTRFLDFDLFRRQTQGQMRDWATFQLGNIGEPTIHPRFAEFVRYLRAESDREILVVTNGKLLDRCADVLNETRCHALVSVDSLRPETHEYIRSGSNYRRLMDNLKSLDLDRARVTLSFTLMRSNVGEYGDMLAFCSQHGYGLSAFPMSLRVAHGGILLYSLVWESLWFCKGRLDEWMKTYYGKDYGHMVSGAATGSSAWRPTEFTCNAHETDLMIDAHGNAILCFKETLPNLAEMRLEDIWNSDAATRFRAAVEKGRRPCNVCDYRERCLAPSMARMENHFSTAINESLSAATREAIRFDSPHSDEEKMRCFLQDIASSFGLYAIWQDPDGHKAIRMSEFADLGPPDCVREVLSRRFPERVIAAGTSWELHRLMAEAAGQSGAPKLLEENVNGYNLVEFRGTFWAVPRALGPLDMQNAYHRAKPGIIQATSLDRLRRQIIAEKPASNPSVPRLVESHFCGFNLVEYLGAFWGAPLALGPLDLTDPAQRATPWIVRAETLDDLRAAVAAESADNPRIPRLIEEHLHGYNVVAFARAFYAVPLSLGPLDLHVAESREKPEIIRAKSLEEVKNKVARVALRPYDNPLLLETNFLGYNLVGYQDGYWAVPAAKPISILQAVSAWGETEILRSASYDEVRRKAAADPRHDVAELVEEDFYGFNLLRYQRRFWAVPRALGSADLGQEKDRNKLGVVAADSLEALKKQIESRAVRNPHVPVVVEKYFHGFNIVGYLDKFWGVPLALGSVDLRDPEVQRQSGVVQAADLGAVRAQIQARTRK